MKKEAHDLNGQKSFNESAEGSQSDLTVEQKQKRVQKRRRQVLTGVTAVTAGALAGLQLTSGVASAASHEMDADHTGNFTSSVASKPAVTGDGTNGATGINVASDSGTAIFAQSKKQVALHSVGGGATSTTPPTPAAVFAEGGTGFGVLATASGG